MYISEHEFAYDAGPFTSYLSVIGVVIVESDSNSICIHDGEMQITLSQHLNGSSSLGESYTCRYYDTSC